MKDREKTNLLTKIGYMFLGNQNCFEISTEVKVYYWGLRNYDIEPDKHYIIDLVGVGWKYLPPSKQYTITETTIPGFEYERTINKEPITRGIEIKVSKSDFKNGFIHCGCHYNYLLVPQGLIEKKDVFVDVGIIEVDLENFQYEKIRRPYPDKLHGLKVTRNPKHRNIPPRAIEYVQSQIPHSLTNQALRWVKSEFSIDTKQVRIDQDE